MIYSIHPLLQGRIHTKVGVVMRFSWIGFFIAACILAPNVLFMVFSPVGIPEGLKSAGILFTILERAGQIGSIALLLFLNADLNTHPTDIWFVLMAACIFIYLMLWVRYFALGREFYLAFKPLLFIPIPMAVFPVLALGFAALWSRSPWLGAAVVVFAIGHFANSWYAYKSF